MVAVRSDVALGVLLVPAEALVSRLDRSYAVQLADADQGYVTVEVLGVSGSDVAVSGDGLTAGTSILMPS